VADGLRGWGVGRLCRIVDGLRFGRRLGLVHNWKLLWLRDFRNGLGRIVHNFGRQEGGPGFERRDGGDIHDGERGLQADRGGDGGIGHEGANGVEGGGGEFFGLFAPVDRFGFAGAGEGEAELMSETNPIVHGVAVDAGGFGGAGDG